MATDDQPPATGEGDRGRTGAARNDENADPRASARGKAPEEAPAEEYPSTPPNVPGRQSGPEVPRTEKKRSPLLQHRTPKAKKLRTDANTKGIGGFMDAPPDDLGGIRAVQYEGHFDAWSSRGTPEEEVKKRREREARASVENSKLFKHSRSEVLELARPKDPAALALADRIAACAAANLESLVGASTGDLSKVVLKDTMPAREARPSTSQPLTTDAGFGAPLRELFARLRPLVKVTGDSPASAKWAEAKMYPWLQALTLFVAHHVTNGVPTGNSRELARTVLPYEKPDTKPVYSDDGTRADLGLAMRTLNRPVTTLTGKADYSDLFAVIEAKGEYAGPSSCGKSGLDIVTEQAFVQLFGYTRQMYATQFRLRFAWGLTQCRGETRACLFVNSGAIASHAMDLHTPKGRSQLVRLLVDWSLGEPHQLGIDPTIRWCEDVDCWEFDVPRSPADLASTDSDSASGDSGIDDDSRTYDTVPYYVSGLYVAADRLFGRHTRCYPATPLKPKERLSARTPMEGVAILKDSWAYVESKRRVVGELGEVKFHQLIDVKARESEAGEFLPTMIHGGAVRMKMGDVYVVDTTDSVLGDKLKDTLPTGPPELRFRYEHMRMTTTPIASHLRHVESVYEIIVIAKQVLDAIWFLYDKCEVLHRDLSYNNIMFLRDKDGGVRAMLIDLDSALRVTDATTNTRCIRTGTLPLLSVCEIQQMKLRPALVDDLESLLYLLIWLGTWGANTAHRQRTRQLEREIGKWTNLDEAAKSKRVWLNSPSNLNALLQEFYDAQDYLTPESSAEERSDAQQTKESYALLKKLVKELRGILFGNAHIRCYARGTQVCELSDCPCRGLLCTCINDGKPGLGEVKADLTVDRDDRFDPYVERAKPDVQRVLFEDFHGAVCKYAAEAQAKLDSLKSTQGVPPPASG